MFLCLIDTIDLHMYHIVHPRPLYLVDEHDGEGGEAIEQGRPCLLEGSGIIHGHAHRQVLYCL